MQDTTRFTPFRVYTTFVAIVMASMTFYLSDHLFLLAVVASLFLVISIISSPWQWPPDWEQ